MGGGNGPVKPDNPLAMLQERVPIPAELYGCREMRGISNVAKAPEMQGFFCYLKTVQDNRRIAAKSFYPTK
jgi:hypothetical protein